MLQAIRVIDRLQDLSDVPTTIGDGQVLRFDNQQGKFVATDPLNPAQPNVFTSTQTIHPTNASDPALVLQATQGQQANVLEVRDTQGNPQLYVSADGQLHGSSLQSITTQTGNYSVTATDSYVMVNAATANCQITLPDATMLQGKLLTIKKIDSTTHTVTVGTVAGQTIDGASNQGIQNAFDSYSLISNGVNWFIV